MDRVSTETERAAWLAEYDAWASGETDVRPFPPGLAIDG